jgi:hypothetical protein
LFGVLFVELVLLFFAIVLLLLQAILLFFLQAPFALKIGVLVVCVSCSSYSGGASCAEDGGIAFGVILLVGLLDGVVRSM